MHKRVWAFLLMLTMAVPTAALADPTSLGVELAGTHGTHRESQGTATAPFVPAPILSASHGFGCFEAAAEGLPPVGPISFGNNGLGMKDIALTYADAVVRYWNPSHTIAVGAGDTLYNQQTDFLTLIQPFGQGTVVDRSRVTGTRYEITARKAIGLHDFVQLRAGLNPTMHGRFTQTIAVPGFAYSGHTSRRVWEHASQVDIDAGITHAFGANALSYGVRYLNYNAAFDPSFFLAAQFADANSLVMPYVAIVHTWDGPAEDASPQAASGACVPPRIPIHVTAFVGGEFFTGRHQDFEGAVANTTVGSIPLYAVRARHKQYEVVLQDVPAAGPVRGTPRAPGLPYDVKAGYAEGVLRYWLPNSGFAVGVGDALYVSQLRVLTRGHRAVRAAGLRYEVARQFSFGGANGVLAVVGLSPSMHQRTTQWVDGANGIFMPAFGNATMVDAALEVELAHGSRHTWVYGIRYLNYAGGNHYPVDWIKERTGVLGGFAAWGFAVGNQ